MHRNIISFLRYQFLTLAWGIFIFILCCSDKVGQSNFAKIPGLDKLAHIILFAILTALAGLGYSRMKQAAAGSRVLVLIVLGGSLYGIVIELYQGAFTAGRQADAWDAFADLAGCLLGIILYRWLRKTGNKVTSRDF